jgi:hypothetical protein
MSDVTKEKPIKACQHCNAGNGVVRLRSGLGVGFYHFVKGTVARCSAPPNRAKRFA